MTHNIIRRIYVVQFYQFHIYYQKIHHFEKSQIDTFSSKMANFLKNDLVSDSQFSYEFRKLVGNTGIYSQIVLPWKILFINLALVILSRM